MVNCCSDQPLSLLETMPYDVPPQVQLQLPVISSCHVIWGHLFQHSGLLWYDRIHHFLFVYWLGFFFLSHVFVECVIRGLATFLFRAADTALQQTKPANSTTSRHLRSPAGTRLAQSLQPQHLPCSSLMLLYPRILMGSHIFREGAWKSLGTVPDYGGGMQTSTTANGTVVTLPMKLSLKFWDIIGGLKLSVWCNSKSQPEELLSKAVLDVQHGTYNLGDVGIFIYFICIMLLFNEMWKHSGVCNNLSFFSA